MPAIASYSSKDAITTATILTGATGLSAAVDLYGTVLTGIQMPATWVAASITFQVSVDGTTYQDAYTDGGTEISLTAVQGHYVGLSTATQDALKGARYIKLRSGAGGAAVDQTATRLLTLNTRPE